MAKDPTASFESALIELFATLDRLPASQVTFVPRSWLEHPGINGQTALFLSIALAEYWVRSGVESFYLKSAVCRATFWLTPARISEFDVVFGTGRKQIKNYLTALAKGGVIELLNRDLESVKDLICRSKIPQSLSIQGAVECEWCNGKTIALHKHHYPIRKEDGGSKTVDICPNCHQEFHALECCDRFKLTEEFIHSGFAGVEVL